MKLSLTVVFVSLGSFAFVQSAFGQAQGIMKQDAASSGKTDVAKEGFEAQAKKEEKKSKDATEAKLSVGALGASGNSRSLSATTSGQLRVRRGKNQVSSAIAVNYARSAAGPGEGMQTTLENYQGRVRYDRFIADELALFLATSARRDRFQGLDLRLNVDPGVAYYFIDAPKQQLWTEVGYDLQYDINRDEAIDAAEAEGESVDKTDVQHSARMFGGYSNALNERVTFTTGLEFLLGVPETENWRLNWDGALTSQIGGAFSLATTVSVRYDHSPLPGIETLDMTTALNLVYKLL